MLSIAGFGINEMDAEFRYVTVCTVGKSSRFSRNMLIPAPDAVVMHFRLPQLFGEVVGQLLLPSSVFSDLVQIQA
jgi:hypothetical protein